FLETRAIDVVDIAAHRPLVILKGRRFPDHRHLRGVDLACFPIKLPDRVIDDADLVGAGLNELDRARMIAGKTDARKYLFRTAAAEGRADEEFRHQPARGGSA